WPAITYPDRLVPGVGADHLFLEGQHVRGMLDTATNVLHVESIRPASVALEGVDVETVLLARVTEVEAKTVRVEIYPDVTIRVPSDSLEEDLRATFTRGEVVAVEITGTHDDGLPSEVQVLPSSFADLAKPLAVLEGGPPWLSSPILSLP